MHATVVQGVRQQEQPCSIMVQCTCQPPNSGCNIQADASCCSEAVMWNRQFSVVTPPLNRWKTLKAPIWWQQPKSRPRRCSVSHPSSGGDHAGCLSSHFFGRGGGGLALQRTESCLVVAATHAVTRPGGARVGQLVDRGFQHLLLGGLPVHQAVCCTGRGC